jgi:hypothetical protein
MQRKGASSPWPPGVPCEDKRTHHSSRASAVDQMRKMWLASLVSMRTNTATRRDLLSPGVRQFNRAEGGCGVSVCNEAAQARRHSASHRACRQVQLEMGDSTHLGLHYSVTTCN